MISSYSQSKFKDWQHCAVQGTYRLGNQLLFQQKAENTTRREKGKLLLTTRERLSVMLVPHICSQHSSATYQLVPPAKFSWSDGFHGFTVNSYTTSEDSVQVALHVNISKDLECFLFPFWPFYPFYPSSINARKLLKVVPVIFFQSHHR